MAGGKTLGEQTDRARSEEWSPLLNSASNLGENGISIRADQTNCADNNHQDDRQHNGVLRYVLPILIGPKLM